ncbi:hypothetical protein BJV78DRAFT_1355780 [Lactifluus subvellereus]|nr:hypothetical protein BJV78DRAFT_1355780 [Lactifluus subvellereus]
MPTRSGLVVRYGSYGTCNFSSAHLTAWYAFPHSGSLRTEAEYGNLVPVPEPKLFRLNFISTNSGNSSLSSPLTATVAPWPVPVGIPATPHLFGLVVGSGGYHTSIAGAISGNGFVKLKGVYTANHSWELYECIAPIRSSGQTLSVEFVGIRDLLAPIDAPVVIVQRLCFGGCNSQACPPSTVQSGQGVERAYQDTDVPEAAQYHKRGELLPAFRINHYKDMARLGASTPRTSQLMGELDNHLANTAHIAPILESESIVTGMTPPSFEKAPGGVAYDGVELPMVGVCVIVQKQALGAPEYFELALEDSRDYRPQSGQLRHEDGTKGRSGGKQT